MAVIIPDSARVTIVNEFFQGAVFLELFRNDVYPGLDDVFSDYQSLGVPFQTLGFGDWTIPSPGAQGEIRATATPKVFSTSSNYLVGIPIYGYYVYESAFTGGINLLWAERVDAGPFIIPAPTTTITVILNLLFQ